MEWPRVGQALKEIDLSGDFRLRDKTEFERTTVVSTRNGRSAELFTVYQTNRDAIRKARRLAIRMLATALVGLAPL